MNLFDDFIDPFKIFWVASYDWDKCDLANLIAVQVPYVSMSSPISPDFVLMTSLAS
jgi:hypothetical protein